MALAGHCSGLDEPCGAGRWDGAGQYWTERDGPGGMVWDGTGRRAEWYEMGWKGTGWDGMERDGTGQEEKIRDKTDGKRRKGGVRMSAPNCVRKER